MCALFSFRCLLVSLPITVGRRISRALLIRHTDTSYATETAKTAVSAVMRVKYVPPRRQPQQHRPPPRKHQLSCNSIVRCREGEVDAIQALLVAIQKKCNANRSTEVTRWVTYRSQNVCRWRAAAAAAEDSGLLAALGRRSTMNCRPAAKICVSGTPFPALSSTARVTSSLTNNSRSSCILC